MKGYVAVQRKLLVLISAFWKNGEEYNPLYRTSSANDEPEPLFSLDFEEDKKSPGSYTRTLDELPCKESPEVLFLLMQR